MISTHSSKKQKLFCPALCWDHSSPLSLYKLQLTWTFLSVTFPFFVIRSILGAILTKVLRRRVGTCPSSYLFSSSASFSAVRPVGKWRVTTINWRKQSSKIMIIYSLVILCYWSSVRSNYLAILTEQAWSKRDLLLWPQRELFIAGPMQEIPSGWYGPILPHCGSQLLVKHRISLILPVSNSAIIYTCKIIISEHYFCILSTTYTTRYLCLQGWEIFQWVKLKGTANKLPNLKKSTYWEWMLHINRKQKLANIHTWTFS